MSAAMLREVARMIRAGEGWPLDGDEFAGEIADWLEFCAQQQLVSPAGFAHRVATAYLGDPS